MVSDMVQKCILGSEIPPIQAKASGKPFDDYCDGIDTTPEVMNKIKKPYFFFSTMDDQFWGHEVIPFNHDAENVLLGVHDIGGHCCSFEGFIFPVSQWWAKPTMVFIDYYTKKAIEKAQSQEKTSPT